LVVAARHPRFSFKNAGGVVRRTGFFAQLAIAGAKIATNRQKSEEICTKMLSASKNLKFFHVPFMCLA